MFVSQFSAGAVQGSPKHTGPEHQAGRPPAPLGAFKQFRQEKCEKGSWANTEGYLGALTHHLKMEARSVMVIVRCGGCRSLLSLLILYTCVHSRVASHFEKSYHAEIARVENVHYLQVVLWPVARQQAIEVDCSRFNLSHFFWGRFGKTSQDEKAFKMEFEVWSLIVSAGKKTQEK